MTDFSWAPEELRALLRYEDGKLKVSCSDIGCNALRSTAGKGAVLRKISEGKIDSLLHCREHGGHAGKFSAEQIASWPAEYKMCKTCLEIKPFSEFHAHKQALFGLAVECRECRKPASKAGWLSRSFEQTMLASSKYRAKKFGLLHTITIEDIVIPEFCPILKHDLVLERNHPYRPTLDQIEPRGGYTPDNVHVISHRANWMKNNMSFAESLAITVWMHEHGVGEKFHYGNCEIVDVKS